MTPQTVEAAGGVVMRRAESGIEICVVHRPGYGDWTLPKGKLDPGESFEEAALREVEEETGLRCDLGPELQSTHYADGKGRHKIVRYWLMEVVGGEFEPNDEVDELRWMSVHEAVESLTYERDRELVAGIRL
ncbi:MAG TPA: NUDIX hydrolase [Thermoleophilaceae bacterium]|nr:NUDIX hydrolase [Thermoleophilaceae bacterium]